MEDSKKARSEAPDEKQKAKALLEKARENVNQARAQVIVEARVEKAEAKKAAERPIAKFPVKGQIHLRKNISYIFINRSLSNTLELQEVARLHPLARSYPIEFISYDPEKKILSIKIGE